MTSKKYLNREQRRRLRKEKQERDYIRSTHIWLCCYPKRMNYPYAVLSTDQINKNYLKRLGEKICFALGENHFPHAFINVHDKDKVIKSDLDKERALISAIKEAYINDSSDLNSLLYKARNHKLISSETARKDACLLSETEFYEKYRFYTENMLGRKKEIHINVILNYTSAKTKFYLKTVYQKICSTFGTDSEGKAVGVSYPFISGKNLAGDVRYLVHADNPEKYQYDPNEIVCVNCNNALDLIMKSATYKDKNKCILKLIEIIDETGIDEISELLYYLKNLNNNDLLNYTIHDNTVKGYAKDAIAKNRRNYQKKIYVERYKEVVKSNREIVDAIKSLGKK